MSTKKPSRKSPVPAAANPEEMISAREEGREPPHQRSLTDLADQAALTGVLESSPIDEEIPGEDRVLGVGDPDVDALDNEYSGEEVPGGTNATPDQNNVDDIGRVYGLTAEDDGEIVSAEEVLSRRDSHRWELDPRSKDPEA